jgi:hypothetical protein
MCLPNPTTQLPLPLLHLKNIVDETIFSRVIFFTYEDDNNFLFPNINFVQQNKDIPLSFEWTRQKKLLLGLSTPF